MLSSDGICSHRIIDSTGGHEYDQNEINKQRLHGGICKKQIIQANVLCSRIKLDISVSNDALNIVAVT